MQTTDPSQSLVILDFETSGMSPAQGARAIEIGAVLVHAGQIVDRFQSLMNPGFLIDSFIENFTGISNRMLREAPASAEAIEAFSEFIADYPLVAHNASFDSKFLDAELERIGRRRPLEFGCSMLVSRRLYPEAPNHKLSTLVQYHGLPTNGQFHRALADAEMTTQLWFKMVEDLKTAYGFNEIPFQVMKRLGKLAEGQVPNYLKKQAAQLAACEQQTNATLPF